MLSNLTIRNFRGFKQEKFTFSKINVFVGPNNSGKSSALSAINLLAQTVLSAELGTNPLILNGQFEQLGTFIDTVHGNRANTPIGLSFGFGANRHVNLDFKYRSQRREIELSKFELSTGGREVYSYYAKKDSFESFIAGQTSSILRHLGSENPEERGKVELLGFWPFDRRARYLRFGVSTRRNPHIPKKLHEKLERAARDLQFSWTELRSIFRRYDALGPFRDQPQRTYLYTGETAARIGKTGSNCITLLLNDASRRGSQKAGFIDEVSRWLAVTEIAKGLEIRSLTPRHFEVCVVGHDGTIHNICDVGFGCSQVLPVIVGALNLFGRPDSQTTDDKQATYVVQEPEIHLHPNAQASLGSLFVGLTRRGGQIFLETHSDNLVLRLARHVALGDLKPGDVTVFLVKDVGGKKFVETIQPNAEGVFVPDWPGGFFPQRQSESLALAKARLKRTVRSPQQLEFRYPEEQK